MIASAASDDSLLAIASALHFAATKMTPGVRPFRYDVNFHDKLFPEATQTPAFNVIGRFENPNDNIYYIVLSWRDNHLSLEAGVDTRAPFDPSDGCYGNAPAIRPPPGAEALADHPPLLGWSIDFPQVFHALRKNAALFTNGVNSLVVTTARRLRLDDSRRVGCTIQTYNGNRDYKLLDGVDDARAVMEIDEAARTVTRPNQSGFCEAGHYLILDAGTGVAIERGTYERCSLVLALTVKSSGEPKTRLGADLYRLSDAAALSVLSLA